MHAGSLESRKDIPCFRVTSSFSKFTNFPAEIVASSDIRPSKNLIFYDV